MIYHIHYTTSVGMFITCIPDLGMFVCSSNSFSGVEETPCNLYAWMVEVYGFNLILKHFFKTPCVFEAWKIVYIYKLFIYI